MNSVAQSRVNAPIIAFLALFLVSPRMEAQKAAKTPAPNLIAATRSSAAETLLRMPLSFEPVAGSEGMLARSGSTAVRINAGGAATFYGGGGHEGTKSPTAVTLRLVGANASAPVRGVEPQAGETNYLLGNDPARWRHHVEHFGQTRVAGVYPGIDVVYYGNGRELEHDYLLEPHADPRAIRMAFSTGAPTLDATGALVLHASADGPELLRLRQPIAYQERAGHRTAVDAAYTRNADGSYGFALGAYDASQPLVIDPIITYSTYFGGSDIDSVVDMQIDAAGNIYLLLSTQSIDMKTAGGPPNACNGTCGVNNPSPGLTGQPTEDYFLAKLDPTGSKLIFGTYIGGSSRDVPSSLAVDATGAMYAWGSTASTDFPVKNAFQATPPAGLSALNYAFTGALVKLSADGSQLLYSTFFSAGAVGGSLGLGSAGGYSTPNVVAQAGNGIVYVAGYTGDPSGQTFSSSRNAQFSGGEDFVAKFDTTQSGDNSLVYATQIGPSSSQSSIHSSATVAGVVVDSKSNLWISGTTSTPVFPVPTAHAIQVACGYPNQCSSLFLMELDPTGQTTLYATFYGGTMNVYGGPAFDYATGLALDAADNIYWGGRTQDSDFPTKNPAYTAADYGGDGWVAQFAAGGYPLLYSSYLPCTPASIGAFKSASDTFLSFTCTSDISSYPLKNAVSAGHASGYSYDAYFGIFDTARSGANSLLLESYLGSSNRITTPNKTLFDTRGNLWLAGGSSATDLPVVAPYQATCDMCQPYAGPVPDGFVTRIALVQIAPTSLSFPSTNVGSASTTMTATISSQYGAAITLGTGTLTDSTDFTATDNCGGTVAAYGSCVVTFTFTPKTGVALNSTYSIAASDAVGVLANLTVSLTGTGIGAPAAAFSPTTLTYSTVAGIQAVSQTTTLTNTGSATLSFYSITIGGTNASSFTSTNSCGPSLAAGASCKVTVVFTATTTGTYTATLTATDTATPATQTVALNGTVSSATPTAAFSPATLTYTTVANTQAANQTTMLTNSGSAVLNIASLAISGTNAASFTIVSSTCGTTLVAGASCTVTLGLTATTAGTYSAVLTATDNASPTTQTVLLSGTVTGTPSAAFSPTTLTYTTVPGTQPYNQTTTLTNAGTSTLNIASIAITGANASTFTIVTNGCGSTLTAGSSCMVTVGCTAIGTGAYTATLTATDSATPTTQSVALSCTVSGTAQATLAPTSVNFGSINTGVLSSASTITLSNPGSATLVINSIALTGANPSSFKIATNTCGLSLPAGSSCAVTVSFAPSAAGSAAAALTVIDAVGTQASALSGIGISSTPPDFTILPTPAVQSTYRGASVTYAINLTSALATNPFPTAATLSATGLPAGATASFSPAMIVPGSTNASTSVMTVTIPALIGTLNTPQAPTRWPAGGAPGSATVLAALAFCIRRRRKARSLQRWLTLALLLGAVSATLSGCGASNGFGVPTSTSTITVTATSGTTVHSTQVTLTIQ
jgi:hypothetical protein